MPSQTISKYKNKRTEIDGVKYQSKREAKRGWELGLLEKAGKIRELKRQVRFELVPEQDGEKAAAYFADFAYIDVERGNEYVVEDSKGARTELYILKRKLMKFIHGITVREV